MTFDEWLLSLVVFLPFVGAGLIAAIPREQRTLIRYSALVASGASVVLSIVADIKVGSLDWTA